MWNAAERQYWELSEVTFRLGNMKIMCVLDKMSFKGLMET